VNVYHNKNILLVTFYLFFYIFFFGIFMFYYQLDLFSMFLWLSEFVIVFIFILFSFYFDPFYKIENEFEKTNNKKMYISLVITFLMFFFFFVYGELEFFNPLVFYNVFVWNDYYFSLHFYIITDLETSFSSYYFFNSFYLIIFGYILLIGTLVCINLNFLIVQDNNLKIKEYFNTFDFYKDFVDYIFLRNQNLNDQTNQEIYSKFFKKAHFYSEKKRNATVNYLNKESEKKIYNDYESILKEMKKDLKEKMAEWRDFLKKRYENN